MIESSTRVFLARKARLVRDTRSGRDMLIYPERGLELSETAARIARLCGEGGRTAAAIVDEMAAAYPEAPRARVEAEVMDFLRALDDRGLLAAAAEEVAR